MNPDPNPPSTIADELSWGRAMLGLAEARILLSHVLGCARSVLVAYPERPVAGEPKDRYRTLVERRAAGEPIAYLVGQREFYGRDFHVAPGVLIPRPETELIVDLAKGRLATQPALQILDLGTGSGALAVTLALELPQARVSAVDRSERALAIARENARRLGAEVNFVASDWFSALEGLRFHLIVANPPYVAQNDPHLQEGDVRFEPIEALAAGSDGLDDLRRIVAAAPSHLLPGAPLLMEHGYDQAAAVRDLLQCAGFNEVQSWCDIAGIERATGGVMPA